MATLNNPAAVNRYRLSDIADELGISVTTVSRALRGVGRIHEDTRRRVLAAAQRLHNRSTLAATSPVMKRIIGLFMPWYGVSLGMETSIVSTAQEAARAICEPHGYGLLYSSFGGEQRTLADELLESGALAGVILYRTRDEKSLARVLNERNIPHIFAYRNLEGSKLNYIGIDHAEAVELAITHCLANGFQQIGLLCGDTSFTSHRAFRAAFLSSARNGRFTVEPEWTREAPISEEQGYHAASAMIAKGAPRAILCCSDKLALGALRALADRGLRVPQDTAVLTIDGTAQAAYAHPPLTAVSIPWHDMFSMATRLLLEMVEGACALEQVSIKMRCNLVVRESTSIGRSKPAGAAAGTPVKT